MVGGDDRVACRIVQPAVGGTVFGRALVASGADQPEGEDIFTDHKSRLPISYGISIDVYTFQSLQRDRKSVV